MAGITVKDVNSHGTITFSKLQKPEQEGKIRKNIEKKKKLFHSRKKLPVGKNIIVCKFFFMSIISFYGYASFNSTNSLRLNIEYVDETCR